MGHKCFISFKQEDKDYKKHIQEKLRIDMIDKSLNQPIDSYDEDYIMQVIRRDYLADSTVTIHLIGAYGAEVRGGHEQRYIKKELQGSLYNGPGNIRNGILGVVLPTATQSIYGGSHYCPTCGGSHNLVVIDDSTVVKEFSYNYYIPNGMCCHSEGERYCVLASWGDFALNPEVYINQAFAKRMEPVAEKVRVRP
jgi:hypothetical protein